MRSLIAIAVILAAAGTGAEPHRDKLPLPSHRLLAAMVTQFEGEPPIESLEKSVRLATPLLRRLDAKFGKDLERTLLAALRAGDRRGALGVVLAVVLLDAEDLLGHVQRDDNTGWAEATINLKKALLDYSLVAGELRRRAPQPSQRMIDDVVRLLAAIRDADMDTDRETICGPRDAVLRDLAALRAALTRNVGP